MAKFKVGDLVKCLVMEKDLDSDRFFKEKLCVVVNVYELESLADVAYHVQYGDDDGITKDDIVYEGVNEMRKA